MKRILPILLVIALGVFGYISLQNDASLTDSSLADASEQHGEFGEEEDELPKKQRIKEALEWNAFMIKDETLGHIPHEEMWEGLEQTRRRQQAMANDDTRGLTSEARWRERGPNNIGGRTRTLVIDLNDPSRKKVWAGAVTGGLWWTDDITQTQPLWTQVNDWMSNIAIGAMTQDPSNPDIMYVGTGEGHTGDGGSTGYGLFKTTDGGDTWDILPATSFSNTSNFRYTQAMVVHPETGDVYAATSTGLYRSQNGGTSWQLSLSSSSIFYDLTYSDGKLWTSNRNNIYHSTTGNSGDWTGLSGNPGFPGGFNRIEFTICEADPNIMYLVGNQGGNAGSSVYQSPNGGATWSERARPSGGDFTNGQAWYDLDIAVNPFNCNEIMVGGVPIFNSMSGGQSFGFANIEHVDQHLILFDNQQPGVIIHGNDGGIHYRTGGSNGPSVNRNFGYNVTQFYACALHPEAYSNYMLGGTQDNNSLQLNDFGITFARNVNGGDGFFCHIDENEPNIQFVSSQFGNFVQTSNGGVSWGSGGASVNGRFNTISDYDSDDNILYTQTNDGQFYRYFANPAEGSMSGVANIGNANITPVTAITADPTTPHRMYFGSTGGKLYRIDNANQPGSEVITLVADLQGNVVSVDVADGEPDHLLVTMTNMGLTNNIYETLDGGETWIGVEGTAVADNLPNIPVRWGIFNPANSEQAMIATEFGVWATDLLDGENTVWFPPFPGKGIPLVRTDMLRVRKSDRVVLAGTHGRGLWTCDLWADPKVRLEVPRVGYTDGDLFFNGSASINADTYNWDLGNGETSTEEDFLYSYPNVGSYDVSLTINDDVAETESDIIKILPDRNVPFTPEGEAYAGSFESNPEQWGVHTIRGTGWQRGVSTVDGKNGTKSGSNAFVTGIDGAFEDNSYSVLYLPSFDLKEAGIYEFSFWTQHSMGAVKGGFIVEYSLDKGANWQQLGPDQRSKWYNYDNEDNGTGAFPLGTPYFASNSFGWQKKKISISDLAGNENVAFRFVFRASAVNGTYAGAVIDDVEITLFDGEPRTKITQCDAAFLTSDPQKIEISWVTIPEFHAQKFIVERSEDALNFENVDIVLATGGVTAEPQSYSTEVLGLLETYFIRIVGISENEALGISDTIVTPIKVVRRDTEADADIFSYYPSPVQDEVTIIFNDLIEVETVFSMYDAAGHLIFDKTFVPNAARTTLNTANLPAGYYFLNYQIGEQEASTLKLVKAN